MIMVSIPNSWLPERRYAVQVVLGQILALEFGTQVHKSTETLIAVSDDLSNRSLALSDSFLAGTSRQEWLSEGSLPKPVLPVWNVHSELPEANTISSQIPIIFGDTPSPGIWSLSATGNAHLGLDVFGSAFFMLTRYEELVKPDRDRFDRFPATASLAHQEGFLERPIINEYAEILWACVKRLWPRLKRPQRTHRVLLSHDVDWPLLPKPRPTRVALSLAADVIKRREPDLAYRRLRAYADRRRGEFTHDPHNTFDFLMNIGEEHGLMSAFYFITDHTSGPIDGEYTLQDPFIRTLMRRIHDRGHEIGLHPSFDTFRNPAQLKREFERLLSTADALGIQQDAWGGRQHYLRWEAPTTWQAWDAAGLTYDSTLTFAASPGFRTGVCMEYPVFNLWTRERLGLIERPLIVMDNSLMNPRYRGLTHTGAKRLGLTLKRITQTFNGDFTLLWHNSTHLIGKRDKQLFVSLVGE